VGNVVQGNLVRKTWENAVSGPQRNMFLEIEDTARKARCVYSGGMGAASIILAKKDG
jgi:hypothetical protein